MTALVQRLVPDRLRDTAERERHASLLVILVLVTTGFSAFYFLVSAWVDHPPGMGAMAWQVVGFLALLPAVRSGLPLKVAGNGFAFISFVGIGICICFQGGLASPVLPWMVFPALMALLLVGPVSGMVWTVLCAAVVLAFGALHLAGVDAPVVLDPSRRAILDISAPAGLVLIVFSVAYALEHGRRAQAARVRRRNAELAEALEELKRTQDQLIQSEKMASLSTVTAGVAHEIKNPLNFVNNFAGISVELVDEIREAFQDDPMRSAQEALAEAEEPLADLAHNAQKILEHGRRADAIVRSMLLTAQGAAAPRVPTDVNALATDTAAQTLEGWLSRHGGPPPALRFELSDDLAPVPLARLDAERALTNLLSNAFDAVQERAQTTPGAFEPSVQVLTAPLAGGGVEIRVRDNGSGIADEHRARVFEPFYTTKPTGSGTGLGLALVHEVIVRRHGGSVELRPLAQGTEAVLRIPGDASAAPAPEVSRTARVAST